jgi:hypothetical protein
VTIIRGKREHAEAERADGAGGATPGRRSVLGGLAALPVLYSVGSGRPALAHASGRADRVTWDARQLPVLWVYGEFGATQEHPYRDRFYTLALQPMSRNPYPRSTTIG